MAGRTKVRLVASFVLAFALSTASADAAPLGPPFASISGVCPSGWSETVRGEPLATGHPDVIARFASSGGPASWYFDPGYSGLAFDANDTLFAPTDPLEVNESPTASVGCRFATEDVAFTVEFYDRPTAPTSFSGRMSDRSVLPFRAPGAAAYVADVNIGQGALNICAEDCTTVASSRVVALGRLEAGRQEVNLVALDGPPPAYDVTVRPLPVAITNLRFGGPYVRGGAVVQAAYRVDGDTSITASITNASGEVVRTLAQDVRVGAGERNLTWDATGAGGVTLADGPYALTMTSIDAAGLTTFARTSVTLDSAPPLVEVTAPSTSTGALHVSFSDSGSGVSEGSVIFGDSGRRVRFTGTPIVIAPPRGGWTGSADRTITLTATDRAGNQLRRDYTIPVPQQPRRYPVSRKCGSISFKANTDWMAGPIRATGVSCRKARSVARRAKYGMRYTRFGFRCKPVARTKTGMARVKVLCTNRKGATIRFWLS